jgi:streptogramin lyase
VVTGYTTSGAPQGITVGPDGALWFTEWSANMIGRVTTAGVVTEHTVPTASSYPYGITTGPDGALWFTERQGNKIGRMTTGGSFTEYPLPTASAAPGGIVTAPDGNLWFNESSGSKIGRITTAGVVTEFPLPTVTRNTGIVVGPDGNLWFPEVDANKIGRMTTAGVLTEFLVPAPSSEPWGIAVGPDGNIWFTEFNAAKVGQLVLGSAPPPQIGSEFALPAGSLPWGITAGPDGAMWVGDFNQAIHRVTTGGTVTTFPAPVNAEEIVTGPDGALWFTQAGAAKVGRVTTAGVVTGYTTSGAPQGITVGPDGALWFTEWSANMIGRVTTAGVVTELPVPTASSYPYGITTGPDGALWFTERQGNKIGRMTTGGSFTEYPLPTVSAAPGGIVTAPDGNLWFNESVASQIGRITTAGVVTEFPLPTVTRNTAIVVGPDGNLWFPEVDANKIGRMTTAGVLSEFLIPTPASEPWGIAAGPDGNIWFTELHGAQVGRVNGSFWPAGLTVDSVSVAGSSSNANGILEPGETVQVKPSWTNETASPSTVTGSGSSPGGPAGGSYGLPDATAGYGTIAGGSAGDCGSNCYLFSVSNPAPSSRPRLHWDAVFAETLSNTAVQYWTLHVGESFSDVPASNPAYRFVETMLHRGVTAGCGGTNYCPNGDVTRQQMAVFLLVSREGEGYTPPACATPVFADVPCSSGFARWIDELSHRGVTAGCAGGNFCPLAKVTRGQMSVFLLRTLEGLAYTPPACTTPMFGDVPCSNPFSRWIAELASRGITSGCGGGNFCPDTNVSRGQMAVFLTVTFGLSLYGP